jgi:hypothetical protein
MLGRQYGNSTENRAAKRRGFVVSGLVGIALHVGEITRESLAGDCVQKLGNGYSARAHGPRAGRVSTIRTTCKPQTDTSLSMPKHFPSGPNDIATW